MPQVDEHEIIAQQARIAGIDSNISMFERMLADSSTTEEQRARIEPMLDFLYKEKQTCQL